MEKTGDTQSCQNKSEEDIPKSSPFDFVIKQFQGKRSSSGKRKEQPSAIQKFFSGFDFGKSEGKERREIEETEINNCRADDQSEKENLSVEDESSQPISEAESPSGEQRFNQFMQKLGKKPNSKNLDLNNCALSAADVTELASLLPFLPELEEISLSWNGCVGGTLKALTAQLHHVNLLKVLRLNNCRLSAEDVTSLGEAFEIVPQLEELDLSWNSNIGGKLSLLTKKLRKGCKIKFLKITDCNLTAKDGESLAEILNVLPDLEVLDLSINKHIGCSMKVIAQDLKNVPGLKELNLHMCGLKQDSLQGLDTALQHLTALRKLDISCNKEIGGGFKDSTAHLASLKNLEVLDLRQCCVTEEDMTVLSQVIPLLSSLQELNLSWNKNIGVSSDPLLGRLRFLPKLKSVAISNCGLGKESFSSLAEAALHLPELEILDLSWNKCVGGNLKLLLGALKLATEIQVLRLSSCNLVAEDLALLTLLSHDGHLARLRKLDLSYNNTISDEGWMVFCQGLAIFKELSELDVSLRPSSCRACGTWFNSLDRAYSAIVTLLNMLKLPVVNTAMTDTKGAMTISDTLQLHNCEIWKASQQLRIMCQSSKKKTARMVLLLLWLSMPSDSIDESCIQNQHKIKSLMHWFYRNAALIFQLTQKDDEIKHPTLTAVPPVSIHLYDSAQKHVMSVPPDLHQQYLQTCQNLSQPENHFVAHVLQEADKSDDIRWAKGITLKIAGNNHLVPVQRVTDEDVQILASVLCSAVFVTGLDLRYNNLTDVGVRHMATFLQENSTLRYLNLMFNDIGTSGAELIANALHSNETLLHLRMTGNKIGNKGGMYFASMLQVNCTLEKLDLGDCDVGMQCLIAIASVLTQNKAVKAINLNRPLLYSQEEGTTVHIALMLKNNSSLVELHLCKHEIKSLGVERLCEALYENCSLRYLDLSCNKITREDVKFLGELLKQNRTLEILDLNSNRIEDVGAIYLGEALALYNRTLKALSVVSNNISGKGLAALSQAMKTNVELSYIYIWGNNFDEAACMAFSELIQAGRLKSNCTDVEPYEVDGHVHLAELSHGLKKHYYWTPSYGEVKNAAANASLAIAAVSEYF